MSRQKPRLNPAFIVVIIVSILLIISLIKNAIGLYQSRNRLESTKTSVSKLESAKQALQKNILLQSDPVSMDQIIRNKLNLALPGDAVVVINSTESTTTSSILSTETDPNSPSYLQWWKLFNP